MKIAKWEKKNKIKNSWAKYPPCPRENVSYNMRVVCELLLLLRGPQLTNARIRFEDVSSRKHVVVDVFRVVLRAVTYTVVVFYSVFLFLFLFFPRRQTPCLKNDFL